MKNKNLIFLLLALAFGFFSCSKDDVGPAPSLNNFDVKPIQKTNHDTKVWAHFMLWYETPESAIDRQWGIHWRGSGSPAPEQINGVWHNLYTRFAPLTGPYFSRDRVILEYQLLLMKYTGIDGVIADWYGVYDRDSREDKTAALEALYAMCIATGIELAVCYEDRFKNQPTDAERIASIQVDLEYLQQNFFTQPIHSKIDGRPLLLIFGPKVEGTGGLTATPANWNRVFEVLNPKPVFYPLDGKQLLLVSQGVAHSTFNWANNSALNSSDNFYLQQFNAVATVPNRMFVVMPGFHAVDGYMPPMRVTPHNRGEFFQAQLNLAAQHKPKYLQVCTWNDYGEGTIIEPTVPDADQNNNNPYIYLEQLHSFTGVTSAGTDVLPYIKRLYDLRAANRGNAQMNERLDLAFYYFRSVQPDKAIEQLNRIQQ